MAVFVLEQLPCSTRGAARPLNVTTNLHLGRPAGSMRSRNAEGRSTRRSTPLSGLSFKLGSGRGPVIVRAGAYEEFPFDTNDYHRVALHIVTSPAAPPTSGVPQGQLVMMRQQLNGMPPDDDQRGLTIGVSGDTLLAVTYQAQGLPAARPLSLDFMWQILERGMETQRGKWQLLRVAIVEIRSFCYIGRAFFGDRETGAVAWDCDCRPSDAVWLAQKTHAPMFVRKSVWNENAAPLTAMTQQEFKSHLEARSAFRESQATLKASRSMLERFMHSSANAYTLIRYDDPEPVKRLKRELDVAVIEQDFGLAARLRDHPFMKLHREIEKQRELGNREEIVKLQIQLEQAIDDSRRPSQSHSV